MCKDKLKSIILDMIGDEFINLCIIDLPQVKHIQVFIKTTKDFIWSERFIKNDLLYLYLEELGYTRIDITSAKEIKGGLWYAYEN